MPSLLGTRTLACERAAVGTWRALILAGAGRCAAPAPRVARVPAARMYSSCADRLGVTEWRRALWRDGYALSTSKCVALLRVQAAERARKVRNGGTSCGSAAPSGALGTQRAAALRVAHVHRRRLMRRGGELASGSPRCVVARHAQALRARGGERRCRRHIVV